MSSEHSAGALVCAIEKHSRADRAGLRLGDAILSVNGVEAGTAVRPTRGSGDGGRARAPPAHQFCFGVACGCGGAYASAPILSFLVCGGGLCPAGAAVLFPNAGGSVPRKRSNFFVRYSPRHFDFGHIPP
eukprot:scaffold21590_cov67-Isochrysis_galbana.AAC.1